MDNLCSNNHVTLGAFIGVADGNLWAKSDAFNIQAQECKQLVQHFKSRDACRLSGITICGVKYLVVNATESSIYAKKAKTGFAAVKTNTCIVLGMYDNEALAGNATVDIEKLARYLRDQGY